MKRVSLAPRLIGIAVGLALGVYYIGFVIVGWSIGGTSYKVTTELPRSAGLFESSEVTFRGVQVGAVESIALADEGVLVTLRIDDDRAIPDDVEVSVRMLSALGENYVDLVPPEDGGGSEPGRLSAGDRIQQVSVPIPVSEALESTTRLLRSLDPDDLETLQTLLVEGFGDVAPELRTLVSTGQDLTEALVEAEPGTRAIIEDGLEVLRAGNDSSADFSRVVTSFDTLFAALRDSDPELERLLSEGGEAAVRVEELVREQSDNISDLFDGTGKIGEAIQANEPATKVLFKILPTVSTQLSEVASDGAIRTRLNLNLSQPMCSYRTLALPSLGGGGTPLECRSGTDLLQRGPDR